ncbi:MAG: glycosyltransferase family 2 protein [Bacteroidales bacterium]|nr:glycosyltransferase family 2 protein [Bacteroidales bacterium]
MEINAEECLKANDNLYLQADVESVPVKDRADGATPVVSIVIPAYKRVSMLKDALSSALSQDTGLPYEVVVVEDNPEPDTGIGSYLAGIDDSRLRYLKNVSNLGLVGNFNRALTVGRGEITVILHDDDFLLPSYVREIVRIMEVRRDADIVCPRPLKWRDGTPLALPEDDGRPAKLWKPLTSWEPFCRTFIPTGMAIRRSSIARSGGFDYISGPSTDLYFIVRAGLSGLNYYNYDKILFVYRWSENESLKFSTRCAFVEAGFPLRRHLLSRSRIPRFITKALLENYSFRALEDIRTNFPDMEFDPSSLTLPSSPVRRWFNAKTADITAAVLRMRKYLYPSL